MQSPQTFDRKQTDEVSQTSVTTHETLGSASRRPLSRSHNAAIEAIKIDLLSVLVGTLGPHESLTDDR